MSTEKNIYSAVVWRALHVSVRYIWFTALFKSFIPLSIFFLVVLCIIERGTEISTYYCRTVYLSLQFCQYLRHISWNSVVRSIFVYTIIMNRPSYEYITSQSLVTIFYLKSVLSAINIYSHLALFWFLFA